MTTIAHVKGNRLYYLYWSLILLLCFFFSLSGYWEITRNEITYAKTIRMGYPPYFIFALGVAKILGAIVLLVPYLKRLKELAFAGFLFDVVFAFISGLSIHSTADCTKALIAFCIILFTYSLFERLNKRAVEAEEKIYI